MPALLRILDQTQKLFGRAFFIAGFTPALILIVLITAITKGIPALQRTYSEWTMHAARAAFDVGLVVVGSYLLGYTIYGIRGALHAIYEGSWRRPKWLTRLRVNYQITRCRRLDATAKIKLDANNATLWITTQDDLTEKYGDMSPGHEGEAKNFTNPVIGVQLTAHEVDHLLSRAERRWKKIHGRINQRRTPRTDRLYATLLVDAHDLQANISSAFVDSQKRINRLVDSIAMHYRNTTSRRALHAAVEAALMREWAEAYAIRMSDYPVEEYFIRATRFGNVLAAGESRTIQKYHVGAELLWQHLVLLPKVNSRSIEDAATYIDFTINMAFLSLGIVALGLGLWLSDRTWPTGAIPISLIGGMLGFLLFSRLAIGAARAWVGEVTAAIDMYRLNLIDQLRLVPPKSVRAEQSLWDDVRLFFDQGTFRDGHDLPLQEVADATTTTPPSWECRVQMLDQTIEDDPTSTGS
jgi:hypothetical protein